jgi:hypothetical protein
MLTLIDEINANVGIAFAPSSYHQYLASLSFHFAPFAPFVAYCKQHN